MFSETLQKELKKYFNKINGRNKHLERWKETKKEECLDFKEFKRDIEKIVFLKIKSYLDERKFDYKNGRINGSAIVFVDGVLKEREYRCHYFHDINILENDGCRTFMGILPNGFYEGIRIIYNKLLKLESIKVAFKRATKFNKAIPIQTIGYANKINTEEIEKVELEQKEDKFGGYQEIQIYPDEEAYYNNDIFRAILELTKKYEKNLVNINKVRKKLQEDLLDFVNHKFDRIIILERLKEGEE